MKRLVCVQYPLCSLLKVLLPERLRHRFASPSEVLVAERQISRFLPLKFFKAPDLPGGPAPPSPAFDLAAQLFHLPVSSQHTAERAEHSRLGFISAFVGQVITVPAAVVVGPRRAIDRPDAAAAGDTVSAQCADEPPANPTKVAPRTHQRDLVVKRGYLTGVAVRHRVYEAYINIPMHG